MDFLLFFFPRQKQNTKKTTVGRAEIFFLFENKNPSQFDRIDISLRAEKKFFRRLSILFNLVLVLYSIDDERQAQGKHRIENFRRVFFGFKFDWSKKSFLFFFSQKRNRISRRHRLVFFLTFTVCLGSDSPLTSHPVDSNSFDRKLNHRSTLSA